jgi:hypothetical protein
MIVHTSATILMVLLCSRKVLEQFESMRRLEGQLEKRVAKWMVGVRRGLLAVGVFSFRESDRAKKVDGKRFRREWK